MTLKIDALEINRNYRIIYQNPADILPREMVATFIGTENTLQGLYFSGRPGFGTVMVDADWVKEIWTTDKQKMHPTIYRGETRVF